MISGVLEKKVNINKAQHCGNWTEDWFYEQF